VLEADDGKSWTVWLGNDTSVGYATYVQEVAGGPIQLASSKVGDLVQRSVDDFRSRDVWKVSSATARRVRIDAGGVAVVLRKDDHGWWLGDDGPRADKDAVEDWFTTAQNLRVVTFEDGLTAESAGLATPAARIVVEGEAGTSELALGPTGEGGAKALVNGQVVGLGEDASAVVKLDSWFAKKLTYVRRYQVDRLEVRLGDKETVLHRADGEWRLADETPTVLGDSLLQKIEDASAAWGEPGLPAPTEAWGRLALAEGEDRKEVLQIGQLLPDGRRVAKDDAGGPPFAVTVEELEKIRAAMP
jgi:hypothetical protein